MAIYHRTGNSIMHTAFAARRSNAMHCLQNCYRDYSMDYYQEGLRVPHGCQIFKGITILYASLRTGQKNIVVVGYRVFCDIVLFHREQLELLDEESHWHIVVEDVDQFRIPHHIFFLLAKNNHDRTEAYTHSCEDIAKWIPRSGTGRD